MKISYIQGYDLKSTETRITFNLISKFIENNIPVLVNDCDSSCDYLLSMNGLSQYRKFNQIANNNPYIKKIMYVWDLYPWTHYARGLNQLVNYNEIWVPSNEVIYRLEELYNVDRDKCRVIRAYADFFEDEDNLLYNKGYAYHFARDYKDPNIGFCQKASDITGIPLVKSSHNLSFQKYKQTILECSFLVLDYVEASTGGLTLLEGYYHGKDILVSDSNYQGARDYFGDRIFYFKDGDIDDYIRMFKFMYERSYTYKITDYELEERKEYCKSNFSIDQFTNNILQGLRSVK
jgi:hypothetical protein